MERDDENFVTVYFEEQDGQTWSLILDQEVVDQIKKAK